MALKNGATRPDLFGKHDHSGTWVGLALQGVSAVPEFLRTAGFASQVLFAAGRARPALIVSTHLNFGPAAHLARRFFGIPYVLVAHGVDVGDSLSAARITALRAADQVLAVSEWTRQRLLSLGGFQSARIVVLPNTYDDDRFVVGPYPNALAARYEIGRGERVILTVARLDQGEGYKGYDRILEALPRIRQLCGEVRYLIVGKGSDRKRLERMAAELGVAESVIFAGFVPDEQLADHYRLADVFAMPSTGEGFGIVFLEAMGCGTPVLGGNRDGSADALDDGRFGRLVDPTSVDEIAAGLIGLLRGEGPEWWFDRDSLSTSANAKFGRAAFRTRIGEIFG